ncbi:hypothetical protein [Enterobacter sp.]|uniref:hypothetical protein n=2 Tax=Enterobacter sp. TaxID=42895 RepID=UPI00296E3E5F|nr:hypothetical protein [Enterobacter sp.]
MTTSNEKLLKGIRVDLAMWREGRNTPAGTMYLCTLVLITTGFMVLLAELASNKYMLLAGIPGVVLVWKLCQKMFAGKALTWPAVLDDKLSRYQPRNRQAWDQLQACVREKQALEHDDVERWYWHENGHDRPPAAFRFLNKN